MFSLELLILAIIYYKERKREDYLLIMRFLNLLFFIGQKVMAVLVSAIEGESIDDNYPVDVNWVEDKKYG